MSTDIQWTDETWNPVTGCTKVSPGCANCYAEAVANRFWAKQYPVKHTDAAGSSDTRPRLFSEVWCHPERLNQPFRWKKPRKVFVNSMSDLFHEDVPDGFIDRVFATMAVARRHTFQVLTKRAERMRDYLQSRAKSAGPWKTAALQIGYALEFEGISLVPFPLPNVWLGVSVENQHFADERIPLLYQTPASVRFLSCEPLLSGLDLAKHRPGAMGLNLVIVGGESGAGARECRVWWVRNIVKQCQYAGVPVFVKQLGKNVRDGFHGSDRQVHLANSKGGDPTEWPEDMRVREYPR